MTSVENRARLVLGNWKMNGNLAENAALLTELRAVDAASHCQIGVCVPFPYLAQAASALTGSSVSWGAQDVSAQEKGAYTGEVSGAMLKEFGCRWALAGHSERRVLHGETDQIVADKSRAALAAGLTPVVCVGESLADRDAGNTLAVIERQLKPVLPWAPKPCRAWSWPMSRSGPSAPAAAPAPSRPRKSTAPSAPPAGRGPGASAVRRQRQGGQCRQPVRHGRHRRRPGRRRVARGR